MSSEAPSGSGKRGERLKLSNECRHFRTRLLQEWPSLREGGVGVEE